MTSPRASPQSIPSQEARPRLASLRTSMDQMARESLKPWLENAQDPRGGAYGFLDRSFQPILDLGSSTEGPSNECRGDKSLIQQARHLYSYSLAAERLGKSPQLQKFAESTFVLLEQVFWQGKGKAMVHQVTAQHELRRVESQIYAQSFAIYGLCTFARVFNHKGAGEMAYDLYRTMDARFHDDEHGGYDQEQDGNWLQDVFAPVGACKCTNTHIHILEALTPLYDLFPADEQLGARLGEMVGVISTKLLQPSGYVHKHFALDWTPVGVPECSYGHDLETSWLVREAAAHLDLETRALAAQSAQKMAEHAIKTGWDPAGGVFDFGSPMGQAEPPKPRGLEKVWWTQAETLPGLLRLYLQTGSDDLISKLEQTLAFMRDHLRDQKFGEFYWGVMSDGTLGPRGDHKGEIWKTPYHSLRALLITRDWIDQALA